MHPLTLRDLALLYAALGDDGLAKSLAWTQDEAAVRMAELTDLKVRMQGDTAIVTGAYHEKANPMANPTNITTT